MKILLTGANGQLGKELQVQAQGSAFEPIATDLPELDITDETKTAEKIEQLKPDLVVNAAAYTHVDGAETEPDMAFRVNRDGPANLAGICSNSGIPLIHISTDYVFDGKKDIPYVESDPLSPIGVYGHSKAAGEEAVRNLLSTHIILRTSWLYGAYGHNFVKTMLRLAKEKKSIRVVDDQFGSPTSACDLARAVLKIASDITKNETVSWGIYHYCGQGIVSWYQFAQKIFDFADQYHLFQRPHIVAIPTHQFPTAAERPQYSALDCGLISRQFGIHPKPWPESLAAVIDRIINEKEY